MLTKKNQEAAANAKMAGSGGGKVIKKKGETLLKKGIHKDSGAVRYLEWVNILWLASAEPEQSGLGWPRAF